MNTAAKAIKIMKMSRKLFGDLGEKTITIQEDDYIVTIKKKEAKE